MIEIFGTGVFEADDLAALGIDAGHDVADHAVFAAGVHGLEDQKKGICVRRVQHALLFGELMNVIVEGVLVLFRRVKDGLDDGGPFVQVDLFAGCDAKIFGIDFFHCHCISFITATLRIWQFDCGGYRYR